MTRVEHLREKLLAMDDASLFFERTVLCTEAGKQYQWDSPQLQTARVFAHVLKRMSVVIDEDDLLVGRAAQLVPSAEQERFLEEHARFGRTLGQWTLDEHCREVFPAVLNPREIEVMSIYGTEPGGWRNGHMTPSWPTVVDVGFKAIGRDTLLDAQDCPEAHRDLLVRVTGYSAHFTSLGRDVQDEIIGRHEHSMG